MVYIVRLKPYAPRKGYKVQRYMIRGVTFVQGKEYEIEDEAFVRKLATLRQDRYDPESPDLFDIRTKDQVIAARRAEARAGGRAEAVSPRQEKGGTVTTRDIRREPEKDPEDPELEAELEKAFEDMPPGGDPDLEDEGEGGEGEVRVTELGKDEETETPEAADEAPARPRTRGRSTRAAKPDEE